jgi:hypothetical protein
MSNYDAFGRLRISSPITLFDANNVGRANLAFDISGNYTYDYSASTVKLESSGNRISIAQSKYMSPYQPGKSLLILASFVMSDSTTSTERVGYFNSRNGIFFEKAQGVYSFVIRNETVDNRVIQSSWNIRQCIAGDIVLNAAKSQIFWCDIEWLGSGSVMCGFYIDREMVQCHQFHHANTASAVYMKQAKLPIRYEITESGSTEKYLKEICSAVSTEGGYELQSIPKSVGSTTMLAVGSVGSVAWPVAIRLSQSHIDDTTVIPSSSCIYSRSNNTQAVSYDIVLNPTVTSATWNDISNSSVQYAIGATMSNGTVTRTGYTETNYSVVLESDDFNLQLGRSINGTSDIVAIKVTSIYGSPDCVASLAWYEI